jgi:Domain of unknown function (DUF222)
MTPGVALDPAGTIQRPGSAGESCPQMWGWCLCSGGGLVGCRHGLEHPFDQALDQRAGGTPVGLGGLAAAVDGLAAQPLDGQPDSTLAERVLALQVLVERLEGHWLAELADLDARGAAGADHGLPAGSTAGWLRRRLRLGAGTASSLVRTARADVPRPLTATAEALTAGAISAAHAQVLAAGTQALPDHRAVEAEPVLVDAARRLDPPRLRRVITHLRLVADPDGADACADQQHQRRGLWLAPTWEGMVALQGCWTPRPVRACWPPWTRWPAHKTPPMTTRVGSAGPTPLCELARRHLEAGRLPQAGGCGPSCW